MNDNRLKLLHIALLSILDEIDRICRKYNIEYFLDSGTTLGAVRHGGFIPWDDDADVGMLRTEYERFLMVAPIELSERFFLQTRETDPDFSKHSAKLRLNNTYFPEKRNEGMSIHQGIYVDIFPFDYVNDDRKKAEKDIRKARFLDSLCSIRIRHPRNEAFYRRAVRTIFKIVPSKLLDDFCIRHYTKYESKPTNTVTSYCYKMSDYMFLLFEKKDMSPTIEIQFEDRKYMVMNNTHQYLSTMYGEYMKLPPKEKRVWHFEGEIRFE